MLISTSNKLNVNTHESVVVPMAEDVVEAVVADPFVEDEIIDKAVVAEDGVADSPSSKIRKERRQRNLNYHSGSFIKTEVLD
ncbi:hypothetical protein Tco_0753452 [Tanacetum coccineum]